MPSVVFNELRDVRKFAKIMAQRVGGEDIHALLNKHQDPGRLGGGISLQECYIGIAGKRSFQGTDHKTGFSYPPEIFPVFIITLPASDEIYADFAFSPSGQAGSQHGRGEGADPCQGQCGT